jgi:hypothetical protein
MPTEIPHLFLHEEVLLLSLKDKKGTMHSGAHHQHALSAAIVAELLLRERIRIAAEGKKQFVEVSDHTPLGDDVLDECLERIVTAKRRAQIRRWVSTFAGVRRLRARVAGSLVERGVLKASHDKVLLIFTRSIYPERDPKPEREIVRRLRRAVFTPARDIDPRTAVLAAITHATGILPHVFDKKRLKDRKKRLQDLTEGSVVGEATKEVVQAMQAAVMVAGIAATTAAAAR